MTPGLLTQHDLVFDPQGRLIDFHASPMANSTTLPPIADSPQFRSLKFPR